MCVYYYIFVLYVRIYTIYVQQFDCRFETYCRRLFSAEQLKTFASVLNLMLLEKYNGYMIRVMAFVYDQQEQFTFTFTLSSISWCPALLKSASNWDAGALNSCDTSARMWTSSWGFANTKTVQCCPLQNNNMLTIISTITSTIAATTTYLTDWLSNQLSAYWVMNWLTN